MTRTVLLLLAALVLTGCDLRLETPDPTAPEAGPVEVVRDRHAVRSTDLATAAGLAALGAAPDASAVLSRVADDATAHLVALGGVYVAFPDEEPTGPVGSRSATELSVLDQLTGAAATARGDADAVEDGPLARLLASIATARTLAAEDLALALGRPDRAAPSPLTVPDAAPAGTPVTVLSAMVTSLDGLAYAWEVLAARSTETTRETAAARAAELRARAAAWAAVTGLDEPGLDPRRVAYDLPEAVTSAGADPAPALAALAGLESRAADLFATAVADTEPGDRLPLLDGLLDHARTAAGLTRTAPAFPGLPER